MLVVPVSPTWATSVSGTLDPTFGGDGTVLADGSGSGKSDEAADVVVAPDGKIVAVGYSLVRPLGEEEGDQPDYDFVVARYNPDGSLDSTFGAGGVVQTTFGGTQSRDEAKAVALQPDGKIVVAGSTDRDLEDGSHFALARYNSDGSLDTTFGDGGLVVAQPSTFTIDAAEGMAIQENGRIVVVGSSDALAGGSDFDFAVMRFMPGGALDTSFGAGGKVLTSFNTGRSLDTAKAVAIQSNGRIVVAGISNAGGSDDFAVTRYNRDGTLDATFGTGGKVLTDLGGLHGVDRAGAVALQANGKIVVAGSGGGFSLVRYLRDGTLDPTFGTGGFVNTPLDGRPLAVAVQLDGRIVAAGVSWPAPFSTDYNFTLLRYNRNGTLNTSFGDGGKVTTDFSGSGSHDQLNALAIQPDGGIVAAGSSYSPGHQNDFALARYLP
ncbi:hypothetical protein GCM10009827_087580 [Dactylosporangium maewongense]|uniref:Delta-60 repeat domain-containing protein n=1 Tax=Dactylosporangium maewongense TaxID=634393 RepID=A0ABP4N271_9ACTN